MLTILFSVYYIFNSIICVRSSLLTHFFELQSLLKFTDFKSFAVEPNTKKELNIKKNKHIDFHLQCNGVLKGEMDKEITLSLHAYFTWCLLHLLSWLFLCVYSNFLPLLYLSAVQLCMAKLFLQHQ